MSDPELTPAATSEQESTTTTPPQHPNPDQSSATTTNLTGISFSIWPPTQRTRDAVINRLIETLSTPSVLSKRYGTMPVDEANTAARQIEDEAYAAAGGPAAADTDGIEILQVYSKEISKRMLDSVKARATTGSAAAADNGAADVPPSSSPTKEDAPPATDSEN